MAGLHADVRLLPTAILDSKAFAGMSGDGRLFYFYTRLSLGLTGIGLLPLINLEVRLRWETARAEAAEVEAFTSRLIAREEGVVWIRDALRDERYLDLNNDLQRRGVLLHLSRLPELRIVNEFAACYKLPLPFPALGLAERFGVWSTRLPDNTSIYLGGRVDSRIEKEKKRDTVPVSTKAKKKPTAPRPYDEMWAVVKAQGLVQNVHKLTDMRREKLGQLWDERLKRTADPLATLAAICQAVKAHPWWGARPSTWLPEKCFRNVERREEFALLAQGLITIEGEDNGKEGGQARGAQLRGFNGKNTVHTGSAGPSRYSHLTRRSGGGAG